MTSPATDLATYMAAGGLGLTVGTDLFVAMQPTTVLDCVTVYDTGGFPPNQSYSGEVFIGRPTVQIRVRNSAFATGYALAVAINGLLRAVVHQTLSSTWTLGAFQSTGIIYLGKTLGSTSGEAHEWTMNYQIIRSE